ncbi:hypothetical protein OJF2_56940 [Aquisphaera giovannonii]|uniref:Sulfotransferase domain protein n=1 Tax=Aquisphaera giovannonii TaxID=406548 RepID=A0A5B9W931_9BACT|nr:hypothetical protein [Aquisphaera giovannonii]QEH37108.1 hypothetical protein OJF2_56940 [Aquisphaera giovannonii]
MDHSIDLVLHPGHSKCGSTSIQRSIYGNLASLERHSVYVPDERFQFRFEGRHEAAESAHPSLYLQGVATGSIPMAQFERRIDEVVSRAERGSSKTILLSSENLCNLYLPHAMDLHRALAARFARVKVLYYIRPQDDWILSAWQQWGHKAGYSLADWAEYCLEARLPAFLANALDFQHIYGRDSVSVIPLHYQALTRGGLLADFYHRLGMAPLSEEGRQDDRNEAINPYVCEVLRAVCTVYPSVDDNAIRDVIDGLSPRKPLYRRYKHYMNTSLRDRILDAFEDDNRELHRRFFGSLRYGRIFARPGFVADADRQHEQVEGLKDVVSVQMAILLRLLKAAGASLAPAEMGQEPPALSGWPTLPSTERRELRAHRPESDAA